MTIVIACKFWKTVAVIADCRVSYLPPHKEADDYLQKVYQIGNRLVLGFAGPLQGAYEVMELVRENARNYPRPPVAHNLQADVERWIRHKYRNLNEREREDLSFVVATVEPHREKRSKWFSSDGKEKSKPVWFPYVPEWKTLVLRPSQSRPGELVKEESPFAKIIGVQGEIREAVEQVLMRHYGFTPNQPMLQMQAIMGFIKFELMWRQVETVGGLFQCAMLNENGIQWLGSGGENVVLELAQGRFVQRNTVTGETLPLMTIWEWAKNQPAPGSFGTFEDPGLRKAIENLKKRTDNESDYSIIQP